MRGRFLTLEGVDGSGKTTQARMLAAALRARGLEVVEAREPGGTPLGEAVRAILLESPAGSIAPRAEVHLFAASRAQLVEEVVRPALARGAWVVCDRFLDSSLAYQGGGRGIGIEAVMEANRLAVGDTLPDLTVLVEVPAPVAAARRCAGPDRIEAEGDGFQARVARAYGRLAAMFPERIAAVPGEAAAEEVHAGVMRVVERLL